MFKFKKKSSCCHVEIVELTEEACCQQENSNVAECCTESDNEESCCSPVEETQACCSPKQSCCA